MTSEYGSMGEVCPVPGLEGAAGVVGKRLLPEIIYIGDPMCSWCWGAAPVVAALSEYCNARELAFSIVTGGLRPGGGTPWTEQFRAFLRHHWQQVFARTGQPFSDVILQRTHFNYDTEPACRAVVTARELLAADEGSKVLSAFFAAIQRKFYVDGEDPNEPEFYRDICLACGLDYDAFLQTFASAAARDRTLEDFHMSREWGVSGFPSFVVRRGENHDIVAAGFIPLNELTSRIERALT